MLEKKWKILKGFKVPYGILEYVDPQEDSHAECPACKAGLEGETKRGSGILVRSDLTGPDERTEGR